MASSADELESEDPDDEIELDDPVPVQSSQNAAEASSDRLSLAQESYSFAHLSLYCYFFQFPNAFTI